MSVPRSALGGYRVSLKRELPPTLNAAGIMWATYRPRNSHIRRYKPGHMASATKFDTENGCNVFWISSCEHARVKCWLYVQSPHTMLC